MTPQRVQMSRQHPWRAEHPDAVIVARPSRWGNPFRVVRHTEPGCEGWAVEFDGKILDCWLGGPRDAYARRLAQQRAIDYFERDALPGLDLTPLRGHDVLCWCALSDPCHGDPLMAAAAVVRRLP